MTLELLRPKKMGNQSNGPAAMTGLNLFCHDGYYESTCNLVTLVSDGHTCHTWSQVVTSVTVTVKDLNNNGLDGYFELY